MSRAPKEPVISEEFPVAYEPRPSDLSWIFWEFGARAVDMMVNSKEFAILFSKKYQNLQSTDHPVLSEIYKRFRESWIEMHIEVSRISLEQPNRDDLQRALDARKKARTLMSLLWPFCRDEMNQLRGARGLRPATLGRGRSSEGLKTAIEACELELREPGVWTRTQLVERFCIYENHKHGADCNERFKTNRSSLRRKLKECGITSFDSGSTPAEALPTGKVI